MALIYVQFFPNNEIVANGAVYVAAYGDDPLVDNISVYTDEACTQSIATPVTLDDEGFPIDSTGTRVNLYYNNDYSLQILDKYASAVYPQPIDTRVIEQAGIVRSIVAGNGIGVDSTDPENPIVSVEPQTIVVPSGQSFRIVDDADSPTFVFGVSNGDISPGVQNFGLYLTDLSMQVQTEYNPTDKSTFHTLYATNDNGAVSHVVQLAADGTSTLACNADIVEFSGIPTYADNAAALLAGAQVGSDYNTPAGDRKVVI